MNSCKCCIDCISCILTNIPMEAGVHYICIHSEGHKTFEDQWDTPCAYFKEG